MKRNTLRWVGHVKRIGSEEVVKKVYISESVGPNIRGRPPGCWRDRVKECMCERGATREVLDQERRECGQGEVEPFLLWPPPWRTFLGVARRQSYR